MSFVDNPQAKRQKFWVAVVLILAIVAILVFTGAGAQIYEAATSSEPAAAAEE